MSERVVVTGMGIVSALGASVEGTWEALCAGRSGLRTLSLFPSELCGHLPMGEVPEDPAAHSGLSGGSRSDHLAVWAARQAVEQAGLAGAVDPARAGVVLGALTGGMMFIDRTMRGLLLEERARPEGLEQVECCGSTDRVAEVFDLGGFRATVSNACASGGAALSLAADLLELGEAEVVLAGGVDSLNSVLVNGFNSLRLIAPDGCRPFDAQRQGMSVGEGAGVLVLETEAHARARGAPIHAVLAGRASSCDAYHATAPQPEGRGLVLAMEAALADAGLAPSDIDYLNAHGTGTRDNDLAESRAIAAVFGEEVPPVSSTKRFFGHTMAAAGAVEAMVCILALQHQALPPNLGLREVDPAIPLRPVRALRSARIRAAMSNSLGFGGNNCSLVFTLPEAP